MARKPLIAPGSVLPEGPTDIMSRVIASDRERNGRAATQDLAEIDAPLHTDTVDNTSAADTYSNTEISNDLSKQVSTASIQEADKEVSATAPEVNPPARRQRAARTATVPAPAAAQTQRQAQVAPQPQTARQKLLDQSEKEAVVRLSIDVPRSMYNRIKQYVAVHNVDSIRALTLALYEDFLTEEDF